MGKKEWKREKRKKVEEEEEKDSELWLCMLAGCARVIEGGGEGKGTSINWGHYLGGFAFLVGGEDGSGGSKEGKGGGGRSLVIYALLFLLSLLLLLLNAAVSPSFGGFRIGYCAS